MNNLHKYTRDIHSIIVIIFISFLVYFNTFANSFHYDDYEYIINNWVFKEYVEKPFSISETLASLANRSIVLASLHLNLSIGGYNVTGFHVINFLTHILTSVLIFVLLKETLQLALKLAPGRIHSQPCFGQIRVNIPLITSLLFAVHPIHTQTVTYISNRSTLMAVCFYLLSFLFFIKGIVQNRFLANYLKESNFSYGIPHLKKYLFFFLSISFFFAGYGSKLIIITAPALFFIYYLFFASQKSSLIKNTFSDKLSYGVMVFIIISPLILIFISHYITLQTLAGIKNTFLSKILGQVFMTLGMTRDYFSSTTFLLTEFKAMAFYYMKMILFPFNQNIDPDFPLASGMTDPSVLSALIFLISILAICIFFYRKNRLISFGILWFYITFLPTSSIIPLVDTVAEHRAYLPSIGMAVIFSVFLNSFYCKKQLNTALRITKVLCFILFPVILFSLLTVQRNFVWKDEITLWRDASKKSPLIARPLNNLGEAYEKNGDFQKAVQVLKKAIAIAPNYDYAHNNLGTVYGKLNQFDLAINEYKLALKAKYRFPTAHFNLARAFEMKGMLNAAVEEYSITIKQLHDFYQAYFNLASIYSRQGYHQKAVSTYQGFIKYKPSHSVAHFELGNIFVKKGDIDKAFKYFTKAFELDNNYSQAKIAMGNVLMMSGNFDRAEETYQQVLIIDPDNFTAYNNLAILYLQHKNNPSKGMFYFQKSLEINPAQLDAKSIKEKIKKYSEQRNTE